jgi:hypothetical protein
MLQIHEFPPFHTLRTDEPPGGWRLTNDIGTFTCVDRPAGCMCGASPPRLALEAPVL